jgi:hypothetical protein
VLLDPARPVVRLCAEGVEAELAGRDAEARCLYDEAWEARVDDLDACIAAHYVARYQPTLDGALAWHRRALEHARALDGALEGIEGFLPSLYLNLGKAHEDLGDLESARACYHLAEEFVHSLEDDTHGELVRGGVASALARVEAMQDDHEGSHG